MVTKTTAIYSLYLQLEISELKQNTITWNQREEKPKNLRQKPFMYFVSFQNSDSNMSAEMSTEMYNVVHY